MNFSKKLFLIALIGTLLAIFWQELNFYYLYAFDCNEPVSGMIETADDASYLRPPVNFIEKGTWADDSEGLSRYFQRPPGYGGIYGFFYLMMGEHAFLALKIFQILLFFFSVVLVGKLLHILSKSERWALAAATIFALIPCYSGFMYFTLTEAVTPFLVLWNLYAYLIYPQKYVWIPAAILLLVRPQLMIFPIAFMILSFLSREKTKALLIAVSFLPLGLWMSRSVYISGEFQGLHPIYSDTNHSLYRPGHEALTDLFRVWESDGEHFHSVVARVVSMKETSELDKLILELPSPFRLKVKPVLLEFHQLFNRKDYALTKVFKKEERAFVSHTKKVRAELIASQPLTHYLITPLRSAKYLLSKSQLNLYIFQEPFRGNILMETVRILCLLLINLGIVAALSSLFTKGSGLIKTLSFAVLLYIFYLVFFQRLNEERYLTPILPLLLIILFFQLRHFSLKFRS